MIFVIAGTEDGRELAGFLLNSGFEVTVSVVSSYGKALLGRYEGIKVIDRKLDEGELVDLLSTGDVEVLVDASHPYAVNVSQNAMAACRRIRVPYIRYERGSIPLSYEKIFHVDSYEAAAIKAAELGKNGKNIFLTTGSRSLKIFVASLALRDYNIIVRVLPTAEVLAECENLGLTPKNIIAMQGPFSTELNIELFKQYKADVIVSKDSGQIGGVDTKLTAAEKLKLPVVLIDRPAIHYDNVVSTFKDVLEFVNLIAKKIKIN